MMRRPPVLNAAAVALGLAAWWAVTARGVAGLPGPAEVAERAAELMRSGQLFSDMGASLARVLAGFVLGAAVAVPVGFLMGWYPTARGLIDPYVQFFRMIPPLAIIPLAIVTMGIGETPKVFVIFLASFLSSVVAVHGGVVSVDKTLISAARVLGARDGTIFLELAGIEAPRWMEARTLMPYLRGGAPDPRQPDPRQHVFAEHANDLILHGTEFMTMIRNHEWKLVHFVDTPEGQLFDMQADPQELCNLWDDPAHDATKRALIEEILRWRIRSDLRTQGWARAVEPLAPR
jgi:hypothetical protein